MKKESCLEESLNNLVKFCSTERKKRAKSYPSPLFQQLSQHKLVLTTEMLTWAMGLHIVATLDNLKPWRDTSGPPTSMTGPGSSISPEESQILPRTLESPVKAVDPMLTLVDLNWPVWYTS